MTGQNDSKAVDFRKSNCFVVISFARKLVVLSGENTSLDIDLQVVEHIWLVEE